MLLAFSVQNFKSIRDLQTLSLEARADNHLAWSHVATEGKLRVVKSAVLYGANASGKSNVIEAMAWFRKFVLTSSKEGQAGENIPVQPFLLSTETEAAASHFEVEFRWDGFDYRYGFEVNARAVVSEWLHRKSPTAKEARLFTRQGQNFRVSTANFKEGSGLQQRTRPNALFLSVCAQFNGPQAGRVLAWVQRLRTISGLNERQFFDFTAKQLQEEKNRTKILELARKADFNIQSIRSEWEEPGTTGTSPEVLEEMKIQNPRNPYRSVDIKTTHQKRDAGNDVAGEVEFDLVKDESSGTRKFIALSGPLLLALEEGSILVVDELDSRLHPRLTQAILGLFHSPANRKNAQLVCATQDVNLLDPERIRRDQVWFCERDDCGATDLYCLADIDSNLVRPTSKFSRQYMLGLFGAVPQLAHFQEAAVHATG